MTHQSSIRHVWLICGLIFVASLAIRLALISKGPYHGDTIYIVMQAERTLQTGQLQRLFGFGYPLMVILSSAFIAIGRWLGMNDAVTAVNLVSVITSSIAVPLMYLIARKILQSEIPAILAAVFFSLSPIGLGLSIYGKSHMPAMMCLLAGVDWFLKFNKTGRLRYLVWGSIAIGLMGAARIQDMVLIIPMLLFGFFVRPLAPEISRPALGDFLKSLGLIAAVVIGLHIPFLVGKSTSSEFTEQLSIFWTIGLENNYAGLVSPYLGLFLKFMMQCFTPIGFFLAVAGLIWLRIKQPRAGGLLSIWVIIPVLFYGNTTTIVPRFFLLILPPLCIGLTYILWKLYQLSFKMRMMSVLLGMMILGLTSHHIIPILHHRHTYAHTVEYARWIQSLTPDNATIIVSDEIGFLKYYGDRSMIRRSPSVDYSVAANAAPLKQQIDRQLKDHQPVFVTHPGMITNEPYSHFADFIFDHYQVHELGKHPYEDWHRGELRQQVYEFGFYQILPKTQVSDTF